jgi:putative ABC transport system permease protein
MMVLNTLVAATSARRREFGLQRLVGLTADEVVTVVRYETGVLVVTGVACGSLASLFTIVPYSIARTGDVVPPTGVGTWLGVVAAATALAFGASTRTARRALRAPAVEAVAAT